MAPNFSYFKEHLFESPELGFWLDYSRLAINPEVFSAPMVSKALEEMASLEKGAIANQDEQRMVGHYWLRAPERAPSKEISAAIVAANAAIQQFSAKVHRAEVVGATGKPFTDLLVVGIGGSALGPQLVSQALSTGADKMRVHFFDNTDVDGMVEVLRRVPALASLLTVVISKSGGTKETRNGMLIAQAAYRAAGIPPNRHLVAVTSEGSELHKTALAEGWLASFPMWDWVGGRTSELSAVGLLPAALQGISIEELLAGASTMDTLTRRLTARENPAMILALAWYAATKGVGAKDMVVLPYADRLSLMSKYLQQLVMESLGKELDRGGNRVHQGIAVYGNKGSTDQHAYVQQLRDGIANFFAIFIEVLRPTIANQQHSALLAHQVEPAVTCSDYLLGFLYGTRDALYEKGRESLTLTFEEVTPRTVGALIALFERAVGFYATFVNVNAYHQPGVEAGKKAAAALLQLRSKVLQVRQQQGITDPQEIAQALGDATLAEKVFIILRSNAAAIRD